MRGIFWFGSLAAMVNGLFAVADHRHTDVAIYIVAVWLVYGLGQIDAAIRERK